MLGYALGKPRVLAITTVPCKHGPKDSSGFALGIAKTTPPRYARGNPSVFAIPFVAGQAGTEGPLAALADYQNPFPSGYALGKPRVLAITILCTSDEPSPISQSLTSRNMRSTG